MNATKKIKQAPGISSREEYEHQVNAWATLETRRRELEAAQEAELAAVREKRAGELGDIQTRQAALVDALSAYAAGHEADIMLPGKRSGETALASYGFRQGRAALALLASHTWESVLEAIKSRGRAWVQRYLTTPAPALNKSAIKDGLSADELASIGLCLAQSETFYIKTK